MPSCASQIALFRIFILLAVVLVALASTEEPATYIRHQRRALENRSILKRNVSTHEISQAQKLVAKAVSQQGEYNAHRFANPRHNTCISRNSDQAKSAKKKRDGEPAAPILNSTVLAAAALLAELDASAQAQNGTLHQIYPQPKTLPRFDDSSRNQKRATSDYWVSSITHSGQAPMGHDSSYLVQNIILGTQA